MNVFKSLSVRYAFVSYLDDFFLHEDKATQARDLGLGDKEYRCLH